MTETRRLRAAIEKMVSEWREQARRVRPLECAPLTAEKRDRIKEWMFYSNRANELEALLSEPQAALALRPLEREDVMGEFHESGCPAIADDESDMVLSDYGECVCGAWMRAAEEIIRLRRAAASPVVPAPPEDQKP